MSDYEQIRIEGKRKLEMFNNMLKTVNSNDELMRLLRDFKNINGFDVLCHIKIAFDNYIKT